MCSLKFICNWVLDSGSVFGFNSISYVVLSPCRGFFVGSNLFICKYFLPR
uniref:Uncharacterized protein n=1 Tax=Rhizophora mucronata TaxID=61149 RepID=A0A2P2N8N1_RHIMU